MKKRIGTMLFWMAGAIVVYLLLNWTVWSLSVALRFMEPVVIIGGAVILVVIGIYLRDDK